MPRRRYEHDDVLILEVKICIYRHYSYDEAVKYLASKGLECSKKKYQRIKKRIEKMTNEKIQNVGSIESSSFVLDSIENLTSIGNKVLAMADEQEDFWKKRSAYELYMKIQAERARYIDSSLDLSSFFKSKADE